jgi:hypothetical protein
MAGWSYEPLLSPEEELSPHATNPAQSPITKTLLLTMIDNPYSWLKK